MCLDTKNLIISLIPFKKGKRYSPFIFYINASGGKCMLPNNSDIIIKNSAIYWKPSKVKYPSPRTGKEI